MMLSYQTYHAKNHVNKKRKAADAIECGLPLVKTKKKKKKSIHEQAESAKKYILKKKKWKHFLTVYCELFGIIWDTHIS